MEYNVQTVLERLPHTLARRVEGTDKAFASLPPQAEVLLARDSENRKVALFTSAFFPKYYGEKYPELTFKEMG